MRPAAGPSAWRRGAVAAAWLWGVAAGAVFLWLAQTRGIPAGPEGAIIERGLSLRLHLVILGVALVGLLAALRWSAFGGWIVAVAALGLGVLAAVEYSTIAAFAAAAAALAPAVLLLAANQPRRGRPATTAMAAAFAVLLGGGWVVANAVHSRAFGPFHSTSDTPALPVVSVRWMWSGAVTGTSFRVVARLRDPGGAANLVVGLRPDLSDGVRMPAGRADSDGVVSLAAQGLVPGVQYHYAVAVGGRVTDPRRGRVRTAPRGPASFTLAVASCATTGSNGRVFDTIRAADPLLFIQTGDLFYANIDIDRERRFLDAYQATLSSPAQSALYRAVPAAYVWDDHDYGTNDSDSASPSRRAAMASYRRFVPHHPLGLAGEDAPVAQAFTVGRVRMILTDARSARTPSSSPDTVRKTMLGDAQRDWFLDEAEAATRRGLLPVWVNSVPWIDAARAGADDWAGYAVERRRIANALRDRGVRSLVMLSGDAHMVAADDGSHSGYATGGGPGFPVLQAAALDELGTVRGGPYSAGMRAGAGQFGLMRVTDTGGDTIRVELEGRDWRGDRILGVTADLPVGRATR